MTEFSRANDLFQYLSDRPTAEAADALMGNGPVLFDLGVLDSPAWSGVRDFLGGARVSETARGELSALESDLRAADTDHDGFVNNPELVAFAQAHADRRPNVALFRLSADAYLNRLPGYVSQPQLNVAETGRLWGMLNLYARQWQDSGAERSRWGNVSGLSLDGFPSDDTAHPPDVIRRAETGELTPRELSDARRLLAVPHADGVFDFDAAGSQAPLSPEEIGRLGQVLENANGRTFGGMTIVSGDDERSYFAPREEAIRRFREAVAAAGDDPGAIASAFAQAGTTLAAFETDHPERLSATTLLARAYMGDLSPSETGALRVWLRAETERQTTGVNGLVAGGRRFFEGIAADPTTFFARNGTALAASHLYRRLVLERTVTRRLNGLCGDGNELADPRGAYRDYERFVRDQSGGLGKIPRTLFGNPYVNLLLFNAAIAPAKDTGDVRVDTLTDLPLIPLFFEGTSTYDVFGNPMLEGFVAAQPGLCRPVAAPAPVPVLVPRVSFVPDVDWTAVGLGALTVGLGVATVALLICPFDGPLGEGAAGAGTLASGAAFLARLGLTVGPVLTTARFATQ